MPHPAVPAWRQREHRARREAMLTAALAAFAEHGYHDATVEAIAAAADIGKGTVYLDFPDGKAGLLEAVVADHLGALAERAEDAFSLRDSTLRFQFWTFALATAAYFRDCPATAHLHLREVPRLRADAHPAVAGYPRIAAPLVAALTEAARAGRIGDGDPRVVADGLLRALFSLLLGRAVAGRPVGLPATTATDDADAATALLFDGLSQHPAVVRVG